MQRRADTGKTTNVRSRPSPRCRSEARAARPLTDVLPVKPGDTLTLYPQGAPLDSFDATITTVAYRAELTRDGFVAYRLKAAFAPGRKPPRIGQLGTARLHGAWAPLAYAALRRPLAVARRWIGW